MGGLLSSCKNKNKNNNNKANQTIRSDPAIDMVDLDGKTYLKYIMNYDSIPYYIPQIRYAKVTDVRQNYTIVVAARFPNNDSPVHRFPIKLNHVDKEESSISRTYGGFGCDFESNQDKRAMDALIPLICSNIVELKNIENNGRGVLYADVYCGEIYVNKWLVEKNLAVDITHLRM
jgi:hypothetical protein